MLVPVQCSGTKPPLFFLHGAHGIMFLGSLFARALGPDQPLYVIHANGIDGRQPVIDDAGEMALAYVEEIQGARPNGPIRLAGMCSWILVDIARRLREQGRQIGPIILVDPPSVPRAYDRRHHAVDVRQPEIARQLYQQAHRTLSEHISYPYNDRPFDPSDPKQMHAATLAGVGVLIANADFIPTPFSGAAELILSIVRAPGFFHPRMPSHNLLCGPRTIHVLPWSHHELFRSGREEVARLLKFILDRPPTMETASETPKQASNGHSSTFHWESEERKSSATN
jgi:thioesterase domain-containing protein